MASPITESVLNRGPPDYLWKKEQEEDYDGGIYQPPPVIKQLYGYVRYYLAHRADYDENQRKFVPAEVPNAWKDLSFVEYLRNTLLLKPGVPSKQRPFPWRDAHERAGFCPEEYMVRDWRYPRRTAFNKYIPPPKDGIYEDQWHVKEHYQWAQKEWWVWRYECNWVKRAMEACIFRHPATFNLKCKEMMDLHYNVMAKTNNDKVKMVIWSGTPAIKDGGFQVRY
ncbi:hypothetical protein DIPPA_06617 [Diplonema papillatum]|nr:hypothetical protein DIPPA_06617 [Diplonema papillatum]